MPKKRSTIPEKLKPWIEARTRFRLSHAEIQMARELGMNPKKFGSLANSHQQPWKVALNEFIRDCYAKQFGRDTPEDERSIEQRLEAERAKKEIRRRARDFDTEKQEESPV
jgi:hypothetical protein